MTKPEDFKLTKGGEIEDVYSDGEHAYVTCIGYKGKRRFLYDINLASCVFFKKLTDTEKSLIQISWIAF